MITTDNLNSLIGANVVDTDGSKVGTVGQVYLDASTDQPSWVTVKTGLFGTSESFAPLDNADWSGDELRIGFDKSVVKDAPRIDADGSLETADEDALYRHYGLSGSTAGQDTAGQNTAGQNAAGQNTAGQAAAGNAGTYDDTRTAPTPRSGATGGSGTSSSTEGYDTSGPTTDDAMTRSEEQLRVGTDTVPAGRARLRKHVVTENQTVTVPVSHEEVTLDREPITDANVGQATSGPDLSEEEHEVQLTEERVVVDKETVPVERVRLGTETVTEDQRVSEDVRREEIDVDGSDADRNTRRRDGDGAL